MITIKRNELRKLWDAGQLRVQESYEWDDMDGDRRGTNPPQEHDWSAQEGRSWLNDDGTVTLYVHQGRMFRLQLNPGCVAPVVATVSKAQRPENKRMQSFLALHGIDCTPKYIPDGSLRGCWRLSSRVQKWSAELANKLNALGFSDFDGKPLGQFSGNGGMFSVFVRGHNELINP